MVQHLLVAQPLLGDLPPLVVPHLLVDLPQQVGQLQQVGCQQLQEDEILYLVFMMSCCVLFLPADNDTLFVKMKSVFETGGSTTTGASTASTTTGATTPNLQGGR